MAIAKDNRRKTYFISYKVKDAATGKYKTYNIYNSEWTFSKGKKYVQKIEDVQIELDKERRALKVTVDQTESFEEVINSFTDYCSLTLKKQTAYNKSLYIHKYISAFFDTTKPIQTVLSLTNIEAFKIWLSKKEISRSHVNKILGLLRSLIDFACDRERLKYEYGTKIKRLLNKVSETSKVKDKLKYWTNEERDKFYSTFEDKDKFKMLFRVCYECALRLGELIALKWEDVDFEKHTISINKSCDNLGNITMPKNMASCSEVSISEKLCIDLQEYKKEWYASNEDFIFFANKRTSRTTIRREMDAHIKLAGVPKISPHGLRHSCASRMINAGCDALLVSKHLRHASTQMTLDTYSHLFPNRTKGLIDKIF